MVAEHYRKAGVDISQSDSLVSAIKPWVQQTHHAAVVANYGGFAGVYDLDGLAERFPHPLLVQSMDGVGTKLLVAALANDYRHIGQDLLSATANDVIVCGATPLTCLDYVASANLDDEVIKTIIENLATHCQKHGIALMGGEMAAMPGVYQADAWDVVGIVSGVVARERMIDASSVVPDQAIIGFASSGLHTNGYSLARSVLFDQHSLSLDACPAPLSCSLGEALLAPHINYWPAVSALLQEGVTIKAMAHITGGGLAGNLQRVLPAGVRAMIDTAPLPVPPIFQLIQQLGEVSNEEMRQVFNLGIGYCVIVEASLADHVIEIVNQAIPQSQAANIGYTASGQREVVWHST